MEGCFYLEYVLSLSILCSFCFNISISRVIVFLYLEYVLSSSGAELTKLSDLCLVLFRNEVRCTE